MVWTESIEATSAYYLEVEGPYGTAQHNEAMEHTKKVAYRSWLRPLTWCICSPR